MSKKVVPVLHEMLPVKNIDVVIELNSERVDERVNERFSDRDD